MPEVAVGTAASGVEDPPGRPPRVEADLWRDARAGGMPRTVALGVVRRGRALLVEVVRDETAGVLVHRPPGGGVGFGERAAEAVAREFEEELGVRVRVGRRLAVLEDLFTHEGHPGHEIVLVFEVEAPELVDAGEDPPRGHDHGAAMALQWRDLEDFLGEGAALLCPPGLADVLRDRADLAPGEEEDGS